ncbi:MAG: transcriptional regulator [Planctomycetota bacterium]|nr:transcriptional regulator [Planctomycetota bacterium]
MDGARRARFDYTGLERVFHEKARLGILTALVSEPQGIAFNDLKQLCDLTDGNLSRHLRTLGEAGLVVGARGPGVGRPQSIYELTREGRKRFLGYLAELERVVADAARARSTPARHRPRPRTGGAGA